MGTSVINLALVDDHILVRKALKSFLSQQSNLHVIIQASNAAELLAELKKVTVHVLLMDVFMPSLNGLEALKLVRSQYPEIKVIVLSMSTDLVLINDLLDIGIHAYISKSDEPESLLQAILSVSENRIFRNRLFTEALYLNRQLNAKNDSVKSNILFDERQKKILQLLWEEKSNKEIANELFLSVRSIEKIRQEMKEKLEVKSTIGLLKYALYNNIIEVHKIHADVNNI
jgi:DNA-binding NarL/FixJ family response regulator